MLSAHFPPAKQVMGGSGALLFPHHGADTSRFSALFADMSHRKKTLLKVIILGDSG